MIAFASPTTMSMAVGVAATVVGELLRVWGVAYAGSLTRATGSVGAPQVIMKGPFAYVRNPLYLGNMLIYLGIGIASHALVPWLQVAAVVFFAAQYALIVSLEEEFLEQTFGAGYLEYKRHVPRFIPRLIPHRTEVDQRPRWNDALHSERRTLQALGLILVVLFSLWYWS